MRITMSKISTHNKASSAGQSPCRAQGRPFQPESRLSRYGLSNDRAGGTSGGDSGSILNDERGGSKDTALREQRRDCSFGEHTTSSVSSTTLQCPADDAYRDRPAIPQNSAAAAAAAASVCGRHDDQLTPGKQKALIDAELATGYEEVRLQEIKHLSEPLRTAVAQVPPGDCSHCSPAAAAEEAEGQTALTASAAEGERTIQTQFCSSNSNLLALIPKVSRKRRLDCSTPLCSVEGCVSLAIPGGLLCKRHGGGRRCRFPGCSASAIQLTKAPKYGYCAAHGGGYRCAYPNCNKLARWPSKDRCVTHGGGLKCCFPGCSKQRQNSTLYCIGHGGGTICLVRGCQKATRAPHRLCSVHMHLPISDLDLTIEEKNIALAASLRAGNFKRAKSESRKEKKKYLLPALQNPPNTQNGQLDNSTATPASELPLRNIAIVPPVAALPVSQYHLLGGSAVSDRFVVQGVAPGELPAVVGVGALFGSQPAFHPPARSADSGQAQNRQRIATQFADLMAAVRERNRETVVSGEPLSLSERPEQRLAQQEKHFASACSPSPWYDADEFARRCRLDEELLWKSFSPPCPDSSEEIVEL